MRLTWELPLSPDGVAGELDDGTPFVIRPIRASDGPALEAAFAQMSTRSRYLRFFTVRECVGLVSAGAGLGLLGAMTALVGWRSDA